MVSTSSATVSANAGRKPDALRGMELGSIGSDSATTGARWRALWRLRWSPFVTVSGPSWCAMAGVVGAEPAVGRD